MATKRRLDVLVAERGLAPSRARAQALIIAEEFLAGGPSCLILGDNIFHGGGLRIVLERAAGRVDGATVFGYWVKDPERYGVVEFDREFRVLSIEEKPPAPRSNYAVTGLYFLDGTASARAREVEPSPRGELEITDVNNAYVARGQLTYDVLDGWWTDAGTFESLARANELVQKEPPQ